MKILFTVLALVLASANAHALPNFETANTYFAPISTLNNVDFEGIIEIRSLMGGCSASLVRFDVSRDVDAAMILTNGHCLESGMPKPNTFVSNLSSNRRFNVLDPKTAQVLGKVKAEKVLYGTMTGTDMALYKLESTYADIQAQFKIKPLTLAREISPVGNQIEVISGYWKRGYACSIEAIIPTLKEADWTMTQSIRYSRPGCETIGGTSGSPIILAGTRIVIGVNNTGNEDGKQCAMNNPCEVDANGNISAVKGYSYGQQIKDVYSCLDQNLNFDLMLPTCKLFGGAGS